MTKKQKVFYNYLQKLKTEEKEGSRLVETALKEFFKYWEKYKKDGVKDSLTVTMEATEAFVGVPVKHCMTVTMEISKWQRELRGDSLEVSE